MIGSGLQGASVAFLGWFGLRGLASILFALFVLEEVPVPAGEHIAIITIVTVALSIVFHGVTAAPLSRRYGERVARMDGAEETKPVSEMPMRGGSAS